MALPDLYQLTVRHNFGQNATVTVEYKGWKYDTQGAVEYGPQQVALNAVTVPDNVDSPSADINNANDKYIGLHGTITVTGSSLANQLDLWLVTKQTATSESMGSRRLRTVSFVSENSKIYSFQA